MYIRSYTLFSTLHPVLLLFYAFGAPLLTMLGKQPVLLAICFLCSLLVHVFYLGFRSTTEGMRGIVLIVFLVMIFNMLTTSMGTTEIFQIGSKLFTLESMCYRLSNGMMLGTVMLWFRMFTALVPNDKFLYLFGKRFQTLGMLLSMILKLFPETKYKIRCIQFAQSPDSTNNGKTRKKQIQQGMRQLSALLEWSMEDGIETADSMRARGYGEKKRGCYETYTFGKYDVGMLVYLFLAFICAGMTVVMEDQRFHYYPTLGWQQGQRISPGILILILFLLTPIWMEIFKKKGWKR